MIFGLHVTIDRKLYKCQFSYSLYIIEQGRCLQTNFAITYIGQDINNKDNLNERYTNDHKSAVKKINKYKFCDIEYTPLRARFTKISIFN